MPDCDYCGESYGSSDADLDHLASEHEEDLGPIDRRRVESQRSSTEGFLAGLSSGPIVLVLVFVLVGGAIAFATFGGGGTGSGGQDPYNYGAVHEHGTINVTIDGKTLDFSQPKYQVQDRAFHFERGNGQMRHVHAQGVTLKYAMQTLGIEVTTDSVTFNRTTYRDDAAKWNVIVTVNGKSVNPRSIRSEGYLRTESPAGRSYPHHRRAGVDVETEEYTRRLILKSDGNSDAQITESMSSQPPSTRMLAESPDTSVTIEGW